MSEDTRLIEDWLPIAALGIESTRERTPMTPFPAPNRLHVWWARRPLVASRAAVLASLLPADVDRKRFLHVLGIHGDPETAREAIEQARRTGIRVKDPYGYDRSFNYSPDSSDLEWLERSLNGRLNKVTVLDPTAGGGSIPFESVRLGLLSMGNDLNPVAATVLKATLEWPAKFHNELRVVFDSLASTWRGLVDDRLKAYFPQDFAPDRMDITYLWARTVTCPYCDGRVPLSPNWRLAPDGTGVRLKPELGAERESSGRVCSFEIVKKTQQHSLGTVARGDGTCPYPDCGRVINGDEIKRQAQAGEMGEQLYAVVYKQRQPGKLLKSGGRGKDKWVRGYRAPRPEDDNSAAIGARLAEKLPEWEAFDRVPSERIPDGNKTPEPLRYGMPLWRDLFSPRQLLCHGTSVEVFQEMLEAERTQGELTDVRRAAYGYLALSLSKLTDYNSRMCVWHSYRAVIGHTFSQHDFSFKWSYAEMAPLVTGVGYDWAIAQTSKCIKELVALLHHQTRGRKQGSVSKASGLAQTPSVPPRANDEDDLFPSDYTLPPVTISCRSGDSLDHIEDNSVDAVVMDPPYYDNVMYAELSDFFYVWLKRTAGHVYPELFRRVLTDKESEAVANKARFRGQQQSASALAAQDYQERMGSIFTECHRVLKSNGILTLMFTHKAAGAWDALTTGLMEAGFAITASWPINTEAEGSMHIKDKAAAKSTIFLVCRPRATGTAAVSGKYWEDVEPKVKKAVRKKVAEFQKAGIGGVDLYLACFGPALEEFSRHWPLARGTPRERPQESRRRKPKALLDEEWNPYATTPEDALDAARREVKSWRLEQLTRLQKDTDLDPPTAFFVLAWDAFRAPAAPYDEALLLARALGADLDRDIVGRLGTKQSSNLVLWDSAARVAKGSLGSADGSGGMIDALHHAAHRARTRSLEAARKLLADTGADRDPQFFAALEAVLEVLPVTAAFTGVELKGAAAAAGSDFEALYNLSRLFYRERVGEPRQLTEQTSFLHDKER